MLVDSNRKLVEKAAFTMFALAMHARVLPKLRDAGAVQPLVTVVREGHTVAQAYAAGVLVCVCGWNVWDVCVFCVICVCDLCVWFVCEVCVCGMCVWFVQCLCYVYIHIHIHICIVDVHVYVTQCCIQSALSVNMSHPHPTLPHTLIPTNITQMYMAFHAGCRGEIISLGAALPLIALLHSSNRRCQGHAAGRWLVCFLCVSVCVMYVW